MTASALMSTMFAYSAMKNTENAIPEYSTWKPATISDSPSATSNGARLVSAIAGDHVDHEHRQQRQPEPVEPSAFLRQHDLAQVEAPRGHQHHDERESHRNLVGHDLGRGAHRAEQGVLRVRRPARDDDAVHAERGHREDIEQTGVDVSDDQEIGERNHRPGRERGGKRDHGRGHEEHPVRASRE